MSEQDRLRSLWQSYGRILLTSCTRSAAMRRTKQEIARVQKDIARLNKENAELADEVQALRTDPNKIESIARDGLGLAKPGEVIIKIPQSQGGAQSKPLN